MVSRLKSAGGHVIAFMDIGTNSVRLLLVRINPNHSYTILTEQKEVVRLGEGEFVEQHLLPAAMDRAVLVCGKFADLARAQGAEEIIAVATSATREAENQGEFVRRLQKEAQLDVRVISGVEEARLIYQGVAGGVHIEEKQALFIDIGGGSTEISVGDQQQHLYLDSLKLGAIRLTMLYLPEETGPVSAERYGLIQRYARNTMVRTVQRLRQFRIDLAIGSSGTILNLADIAARSILKRRLLPEDTLTYPHLREVVKQLCALPLEERRKVPGVNPERADIIIAGAAILETLMQELQLPEIRLSSRGVREGLLVDYLSRDEFAHIVKPTSVRERSVLQLGRVCAFDEQHARNVARLALDLFDSGRETGLHRFGAWERDLLYYAALLHDIGAFLSYSDHHAHSYYFIRNADLLGFDQTETAIMAATAFFHRKTFPRKKHHEFAILDDRSRGVVQGLCVLLRIAESLDRGHSGTVAGAHFTAVNKKTVALTIDCAQDCQLELWGVQNHVDAVLRAFHKRLVIDHAE
ncbi:MAG: Ppx/GppA phosphatase family protein [Armatimonadota bacterium]